MLQNEDLYNMSNYLEDHLLHRTTKKKVLGNTKDECARHMITEYIGLRLKMYSIVDANGEDINDNNDGPNGHLFYVGGDLMMRRGMMPIIMVPDGDLSFVLHLVSFWILTIWGSVHIEETVVG